MTETALTEADDYGVADSAPARPARALGAECPHCGSRAKHGERIGCCSGCKTLFTSMSAFDRHRRNLQCLKPRDAGLVPKILKTDPGVIAWGWPAGNNSSPFDVEG